MAVVQLATSADVVAALGRALTTVEAAKVGAILDKASELFRRRSGQQFTFGASVQRLKVNGGRVRLSQRPVVAVATVTDDAGAAVPFTIFKSVLTVALTSDAFVTVDYTHGGDVPDIVRLCIADIARKVLTINVNAAAGVVQRSETTGPFNEAETYATWAVGGQTMLAPDDIALADTFKVKHGSVIVQSA